LCDVICGRRSGELEPLSLLLTAARRWRQQKFPGVHFFFVTAVALSVDNLSGASPGAFLSNDVFLPASGLSSDVALSGPIAAMTGNAVPLSCDLLAI
jgi:hypothetical protein